MSICKFIKNLRTRICLKISILNLNSSIFGFWWKRLFSFKFGFMFIRQFNNCFPATCIFKLRLFFRNPRHTIKIFLVVKFWRINVFILYLNKLKLLNYNLFNILKMLKIYINLINIYPYNQKIKNTISLIFLILDMILEHFVTQQPLIQFQDFFYFLLPSCKYYHLFLILEVVKIKQIFFFLQ